MIDLLPIVLRVHTRSREHGRSPGRQTTFQRKAPRWGDLVLVFDTETSIDSAQAFKFGSARLCRWRPNATLECVREYLFHADDLEKNRPDEFQVLKSYWRTHRKENKLSLCSRRDFLERVLWPLLKGRSLIVGFSLPFDLSRIAVDWKEARGTFAGGFSLILAQTVDNRTGRLVENRFRPRIRIKHLDSKRALMDIARSGSDVIRAKLLDLRTLSFALTNRGHSLESGCKAFGATHGKGKAERHGRITHSYVDYNRQDVLATNSLLDGLRTEFDKHPVDLDPANTMSPASLAKAYLRAMGLVPPSQKFQDLPVEPIAAAMNAYYGGRAECRIRKTVRPVVYCDFLSMYPTVNTLIGLWRVLIAKQLKVVDATADVQTFLATVAFEQCFDPATWKGFNFVALIEPSEDIVPVRAPYAEGSRVNNIGVNPLTYHRAIPFAGPDLVASKLHSGKVARVVRAWRFEPFGIQTGLRPVKLRNEVEVDPRRDDFF